MAGSKSFSSSQWQKKPNLTHFLCLPLVNETSEPQLDRSLKKFIEKVCSDAVTKSTTQSEQGSDAASQSQEQPLPVKAIRPLGTLHLTLGVMTLTKDRLAKVIEALDALDVAALLKSHSGTSPGSNEHDIPVPALSLDLKGLESMHDPESTSILYIAPSDPTDRLYNFCLALRKHFEDFLVPDDRPLKLHATIVNTIYAKSKKPADRSQGHGPKAKGSFKLDARGLLGEYKDFVWAEHLALDRIAICEMGAKKVMDANKVRVLDERYTEVATTALPS